MGKKWKRKVIEKKGTDELEVMTPGPGDNPGNRPDTAKSITVATDPKYDDQPAKIEWQALGDLTFVGPDADPEGNTSVIWKEDNKLPWTLDSDKKLTILDDDPEPRTNSEAVKLFPYRIGAYDSDGDWVLTPDPEVRNKRDP